MKTAKYKLLVTTIRQYEIEITAESKEDAAKSIREMPVETLASRGEVCSEFIDVVDLD